MENLDKVNKIEVIDDPVSLNSFNRTEIMIYPDNSNRNDQLETSDAVIINKIQPKERLICSFKEEVNMGKLKKNR